MINYEAWEKQMRSAMQHRGTTGTTADDDEDNGEQVEREAKAPKKMPGWMYKSRQDVFVFCFYVLFPQRTSPRKKNAKRWWLGITRSLRCSKQTDFDESNGVGVEDVLFFFILTSL